MHEDEPNDKNSQSEELSPELQRIFKKEEHKALIATMRDAALEEGLVVSDSEIKKVLDESSEEEGTQ